MLVHTQDLDLARRVVGKDKKAAEYFFDTYFSRLYRFVALRVDRPDACEDVVQETMIKALRHLSTYRGEAALFTWLCQIGRNEVSNYFRRHGRKEEMLVSLDDNPDVRATLESVSDPDSTIDTLATERIVQLTLDYLPDRYGQALEWKYLDGLSVDEIAGRMDLGVIAVQSLLARAREAFRKSVREVERELGVTI